MGEGSIAIILGENGHMLFKEGLEKLIAEIDRRSAIEGHRFRVRTVIQALDLPYIAQEFILAQYEAKGRRHLQQLVKEGVLRCDRPSKPPQPYWYVHEAGCNPNPRLGPDIDYNQYYLEKKGFIRLTTERKIETSPAGTSFMVSEELKALPVPYVMVPAMAIKCTRLLAHIFSQHEKAGYLAKDTTKGKGTIFRRTYLTDIL